MYRQCNRLGLRVGLKNSSVVVSRIDQLVPIVCSEPRSVHDFVITVGRRHRYRGWKVKHDVTAGSKLMLKPAGPGYIQSTGTLDLDVGLIVQVLESLRNW
jgi:hypothetical protein